MRSATLAVVAFLTVAFEIQAAPAVWVASSLDRIGRTAAPTSQAEARIYAARGEWESYQIVVHAPAAGLKNVNVQVSDLKGPAVIPARNFTLYREHYVRVDASSPDWHGANRPGPPGWYADGLIPFANPLTRASLSAAKARLRAAPFDVAPNTNQPIWVDLLVPRSAPAGRYNGTFQVTSDQGGATGQVVLTVWNFTLPEAPYLKSSFACWKTETRGAEEELLRNRLSPQRVKTTRERELMRDYGLNSTDLHFWSGADNGHCSMSPPPPIAQLKSAAASHAPGLFLYNFTADEIVKCKDLYPTIRKWGYNLHQAGVRNLLTIPPVEDLFTDGSDHGRSAVDIWVVLPAQYGQYASNIAKALKKGDALWSYNTLVQDAASPKWLIDFTPVDFRIQPGFLSQALHFTGLLYWRVDMWSDNPWDQTNNQGKISANNYPGEGVLIYPGQPAGFEGVAPSIRLKWLRDGVDDYDYIQLLRQTGQAPWVDEVVKRVAQNFADWTHDPKALQAARQELGEKLNQLHPEPKPENPQ